MSSFLFMSNEQLYWFSYISIAFTILPFLVGLFCIRKVKTYLLPVFALTFIGTTVEILGLAIASDDTSNLITFHVYTLSEFSLITLFYMLFYKQYFKVGYLLLLFPVFYIVEYIDYKINGFNSLDNFSVTVESSIFILMSLLSFAYLLRNLIYENVLSLPFFWINSGILIYFSGNILLFISDKSLPPADSYLLFLLIHSPLNVIYNVLICIGFIKAKNA